MFYDRLLRKRDTSADTSYRAEDRFFCGDGWVWRPYPTLYRGLGS